MTTEEDVYEALKYRVVDCHGICRYYNAAGELHRVGGPAVTYPNGAKLWYQNGALHREDGPAVEYAHSGGVYWFLFGVCHGRLQHQRKVEEIKRTDT